MSDAFPPPFLPPDRLAEETRRAEECLTFLTQLHAVEKELWRENLPTDVPFDRVFGMDGKLTPECQARMDEFRRQQGAIVADLIRRRDALRDAIRERSGPLMRVAVRREIAEQPSRLRNLIEAWTGGRFDYSHPPYLGEARHFLADLILKLDNCREPVGTPGRPAGGQGSNDATGGKGTGNADPEAPSLDREDIAILRALQENAPRLCTTYEIEAGARVARRTVGARLNRLIELGLAVRPRGPKQGATVTPSGVTLLERCPAPK